MGVFRNNLIGKEGTWSGRNIFLQATQVRHIRQRLVTSLVCNHWACHSFCSACFANLWKDYFNWTWLKATSILALGSFLSLQCFVWSSDRTHEWRHKHILKPLEKWILFTQKRKTTESEIELIYTTKKPKKYGSEISLHVHFKCIQIWELLVNPWSMPLYCFLRQETLLQNVSLHGGV